MSVYLNSLVKDGGSSKVDEFLVSIAVILGIVFVLYCLYVRFLPSLRRFLDIKELEGQRLTEKDSKSSKIRKFWNKLVTMTFEDSLEQPNLPMQSIETEVELKKTNPDQFEHTVNIAQKRSLPSSVSTLTENNLGRRRAPHHIPSSINHTEGSADDLNLLFRSRTWRHASLSANHIEGSANNLDRPSRWTQIIKETNDDMIAMTSDRGTYDNLFPLDVEATAAIEEKQRIKRRSLTSISSQILDVDDQAKRLRRPKGVHSSKNIQTTMTTRNFKRSDFEDNWFQKIDEIAMHGKVSDGTMYEPNLESQEGEISDEDKVVTLDNVIGEHNASSYPKQAEIILRF